MFDVIDLMMVPLLFNGNLKNTDCFYTNKTVLKMIELNVAAAIEDLMVSDATSEEFINERMAEKTDVAVAYC